MTFFNRINNENELVHSRHCWLDPFDCSNERTFILLIGMRGIGKTTLGNIMNKWYILDFIDMDEYFSKIKQCTINQYVEENGWDEFRKQEIKYLSQAIEINRHFKTPNTSPLIIACGGGIVTTKEARSFLFELRKSSKVIIIHIRRDNMDKWIFDSTNIEISSSHRPHISTPINELWEQRKQYYQDLSHADYILDYYIKSEFDLASEFIDYINLLLKRPLQSRVKSHFSQIKYEYMYYCLSFSSISSQFTEIQDMMSGIDAVEYRADLIINNLCDGSLWNHLNDFRRTISHSLPFCFSVRSIKHGGKYSASLDSLKDILKQAISFGCSWIDMEWETLNEKHLEELLILCNSKHIIPIISYHGYIEHRDQWDNIYDAISSFSNSINKMYKIETILIKIISWCDSQDAVSNYFSWIKDHQNNSLIAHCAGNGGRDTRIYQSLYSPLIFLTIPNIDSTASGQYTVNQLNQTKTERGYILPKNFYLFGSPIQHSLSPSIHNSAFNNLGLPFSYSKHDASDASQTTIKILDESNKFSMSFGGSSITAPLKQSIYHQFGKECTICPCVSSIKVANTLNISNGTISMTNTDWIAMFHLMNDRILSIRRDIALTGSCKISHNAILLGLGATAQSSIFALDRICIPPDHILLWNRTKSLIPSFIKDFKDIDAELLAFDATNISSIVDQSDNTTIHLSITSSLPLEQNVIISKVVTLLEQYINMLRDSNSNIFITLVEWNYAKSSSPLLDALYKIISPSNKISLFHISGKSLLLEQAIYQSYYWTGMTPPRNAMIQAME